MIGFGVLASLYFRVSTLALLLLSLMRNESHFTGGANQRLVAGNH